MSRLAAVQRQRTLAKIAFDRFGSVAVGQLRSLGDTRITATVNDTLLTAVTAGDRTAANFANNSGPRQESQHAPDSNSAHFSCARYPCRATACQLQAVTPVISPPAS